MFNFGLSLFNRFSNLLALKVLPDEDALRSYMRSAFKGIAFLIIGSVIMGATIAASLYILYEQLVYNDYNQTQVISFIMLIAVLMIVIFFALANRWLSSVKPIGQVDEKIDYVKDIASASITGFMEGLFNNQKSKTNHK